ncbi:MAG: phage holin family protein [Sphingomonadaceae bacterium]|nr:phage holin family protein [Sphingomonadaceae bacterium]
MDMRSNPKPQETPEPTIGELIRSLLVDVGQLVRTEIKLVYAEVGRNVARATRPLAFIAVGATFLFGAFLALLGAFVGWLAPLVGVGTAALIVAVGVGGIGIAMVMTGRKRLMGISLVPTRSIMPARPPVASDRLKGNE